MDNNQMIGFYTDTIIDAFCKSSLTFAVFYCIFSEFINAV